VNTLLFIYTDVTYFVQPDSPIDKEAAHRSTSTYLVERRLDMLPGLLTTQVKHRTSCFVYGCAVPGSVVVHRSYASDAIQRTPLSRSGSYVGV
jgi:hypothetical protein